MSAEEKFQAFVDGIAKTYLERPVPVVIRDNGTTLASRGRIITTLEDLKRSDEELRWTAAHEIAHIKLKHDKLVWPHAWATLAAGAAAVPMVLLGGLGVLGWKLPPIWAPVVLLLTVAASFLLCGGTLMQLLVRTRKREKATDLLAAEWGYPVTEAIAVSLQGDQPVQKSRWQEFLRTHPAPSERLAYMQEVRSPNQSGIEQVNQPKFVPDESE